MAALQAAGSPWSLATCLGGRVESRGFDEEGQAREALTQALASAVLFDGSGLPVAFSSRDAVDIVIILRAQQTGSAPDRGVAEMLLRSGDAPLVPPARSLAKQFVMKRTMDLTFCRLSVRFFSASPLRNTSLCFFDAQRFPSLVGHVALTIDDAPGRLPQASSRISDVADLLQAHGAHASFFLMGGSIRGHEADLARLVREGHELCNHAVADRPYHEDSPEEFAAAVDSCSEQIRAIQRSADVPACVRWFRAPHGKYTESMEGVLHERLLTNTMCDCYASDPVVEDGEWIGNFLVRRAGHGSILLLHMPERGFREHCLEALRVLLDGLQRRGLRAVSLAELARLALGRGADAGEDFTLLQRDGLGRES